MLASYGTDGDLDDLRSELATDPDLKARGGALSRPAQYDSGSALPLLLAAGAHVRARRPAPLRARRSQPRIHQDRHRPRRPPWHSPGGEIAIREAVPFGTRDVEVAPIVDLLIGAGWPVSPASTPGQKTAVELATAEQSPRTLAPLSRACPPFKNLGLSPPGLPEGTAHVDA